LGPLRAQRFAKTRSDINHEMQAFEIAQRGNFVVVMFRVKPTIRVARFPRKGVVRNEGSSTNSKSVNRSALRPDPSVAAVPTAFIRLRSSCLPKAMTTSTGSKIPMNRTSGSSKKASWIALGDRRTAPLD